MLNYAELQTCYVDLYTELRKYIWDFQTVEKLANLEISVYRTFPDVEEVRKHLTSLTQDVKHVFSEDEALKNAVDKFTEVLDSVDSIYAKLNQVTEVVQQ